MCDEVTAQLTGVGVRDATTTKSLKLVIPLPHIVPPLHEFLLSVAHLVQIKVRLRPRREKIAEKKLSNLKCIDTNPHSSLAKVMSPQLSVPL